MIVSPLQTVQDRLQGACLRAHRPSHSVRLMVVSKTQPIQAIQDVYDTGHRLFGENRVQELLEKAPSLPADIEWHLIGPVQRNKLRKALRVAHCLQTVESLAQAQDIQRMAEEEGLTASILLQVNVSADPAKHGYSGDQLRADLAALLALSRVSLKGLMTIPVLSDAPEAARPHFRALRELRDCLAQDSGLPLSELSMGMSNDFEVAIEEGATLVRVGSAIFGDRTG